MGKQLNVVGAGHAHLRFLKNHIDRKFMKNFQISSEVR